VYYVQLVDGEFIPVFDGEPLCAKKLIDHGKVRKLKKSEVAKG
jgi:hypothetical protein